MIFYIANTTSYYCINNGFLFNIEHSQPPTISWMFHILENKLDTKVVLIVVLVYRLAPT
jgi:hypothetical protein